MINATQAFLFVAPVEERCVSVRTSLGDKSDTATARAKGNQVLTQDAEIFTALGGAGIGATFHVLAHIGDRDPGGSDSDIVILAVVAVLLLAGAAWKLASDPRI